MRKAAIVSLLGTALLILLIDLRWAGFLGPLLDVFPRRDRGGHFALMAILGFVCNLGFSGARIGTVRPGVLGVSLALVLGAALEEYSQRWLGHRNFDLTDLRYSVWGVLAGSLAALPLVRRLGAGGEARSEDER